MTRAMSWSGAFALLLVLTAGPGWAAAPDDGEPGWIPYAEVALDLHQDELHSEVRSLPGTAYTGAKNYHNTPLGFDFRIGILTPIIEPLPLKARVFLDIGAYVTTETKEDVLEFGDLDGPTTGNLGSRITRRFENPAGMAGLGMEFTLPFVDERFKLRPSIEYAIEKQKIRGKLASTTSAIVSVDRIYNSLGFGVDGEFVVTGGLSLFIETRLLWLLTDDKLTFFNAPGTVKFVYDRRDDPVFHGAFGVRYSFRGL